MNYRLYIDESGRNNYIKKDNIAYRYLALTGVILSDTEVREKLNPTIYSLKKQFISDPDNIPNLHAESIVRKEYSFACLQDDMRCASFQNEMVDMIQNIDFHMTTVVIDKISHLEKYGDASENPYAYCLKIILERYVKFLESRGSRGDVMAESRGEKEDDELGQEYSEFYSRGTYFVSPERIQRYITSRHIKFEKKVKNIAGLELVDQIVLSSKFDVLLEKGIITEIDNPYIRKIVSAIQNKYLCKEIIDGQNICSKIDGYGKKFLS